MDAYTQSVLSFETPGPATEGHPASELTLDVDWFRQVCAFARRVRCRSGAWAQNIDNLLSTNATEGAGGQTTLGGIASSEETDRLQQRIVELEQQMEAERQNHEADALKFRQQEEKQNEEHQTLVGEYDTAQKLIVALEEQIKSVRGRADNNAAQVCCPLMPRATLSFFLRFTT